MADSAPDQQPGTGQLGLVPKIINPMDIIIGNITKIHDITV